MKYIFIVYYILVIFLISFTIAFGVDSSVEQSVYTATYTDQIINSSNHVLSNSNINSSSSNSSNSSNSSVSLEIDSKNNSFGLVTAGNVYFLNNAAKLKISSDTNWGLNATCTDFTNISNEIPVNRLRIKISKEDNYIQMSSTGITLLSNQSEGNSNIFIDYQLATQLTDPPGQDFSGTITYTLYTF